MNMTFITAYDPSDHAPLDTQLIASHVVTGGFSFDLETKKYTPDALRHLKRGFYCAYINERKLVDDVIADSNLTAERIYKEAALPEAFAWRNSHIHKFYTYALENQDCAIKYVLYSPELRVDYREDTDAPICLDSDLIRIVIDFGTAEHRTLAELQL